MFPNENFPKTNLETLLKLRDTKAKIRELMRKIPLKLAKLNYQRYTKEKEGKKP